MTTSTGFASVQLESSAKFADATQTRMDVVYALPEGEQKFVNRVLVSGCGAHNAAHCEPRRRHSEGAPLSQEKMLLTQRNLYDLGIFNEVQTAVENPEGDENIKTCSSTLRKPVAGRSTMVSEWKLEAG